jgi:hypothetical protein
MPAKETLIKLKSKMPSKHDMAIIPAYKKRYGIDISRWMAMRFFKRDSYSEKLQNTIFNVAFTQQKLKNKTNYLTGHIYKISILQYYRERKGLVQ